MNFDSFTSILQQIKFNPKTLIRSIILIILGATAIFMGYTFINQIFFNPPMNPIVPIEKRRTVSDLYIQLNVVNASGVKGIAKKIMGYCRERGFDVVEIETAKTLSNTSYVVDHLSDTISARNVAYALGIPDSMIKHNYDTTLYLRASVYIGKDYTRLKPFSE